MSQIRPFYEDREQLLDCHIWHHPNYPLHLHKHLEFIYNAGGEVTIVVSGQERTLHAGECALVFPYQIHSFASKGEVDMTLIIADMEYMGEFQKELSEYELECPFFSGKQLSDYGQKLLELVRCSAYDKDIPYQLDKGLLLALLADIFHQLPLVPKKKRADLSVAQRLLQYINENILQELTATDVAKAVGISSYYLSHIFSEQLKISFPTYIAQQRLILACDMLKRTQKSVTEVVYEAGFPNMRTFNRCFQKQYGCTPTEWRKRSG